MYKNEGFSMKVGLFLKLFEDPTRQKEQSFYHSHRKTNQNNKKVETLSKKQGPCNQDERKNITTFPMAARKIIERMYDKKTILRKLQRQLDCRLLQKGKTRLGDVSYTSQKQTMTSQKPTAKFTEALT